MPLKRSGVASEIWTQEGEELDVSDWVRNQFTQGSFSQANPSLRSKNKLHPDDVLVTKKGNLRVGDIDRMITGVFCPFHADKSPGEFVNKSEKGNIYLSCHKCGTIYMEQERPDYIETFLAEQKAKHAPVVGEAEPPANQIEADIAAHDLVEFDNDLAVEPFNRERRAEILIRKHEPRELRTLLYASEGFGKSYLASVLCKRGSKVVFACKSNVQAAEQAQGFLDQGIKVQMIFSRDYWLQTNHKVEVAHYDQTHPWDYERLNEARTKRNMRAMGMAEDEINRLWDLYAPAAPDFERHDMVITTQARVMGWGRINEIRKRIRMKGVEPLSIPFDEGSLEQQERIVESRQRSGLTGSELYNDIPIDPFTYVRDIVPSDAVIFCDDADTEDFCLLKDFNNKFAEKAVGGRPIETKQIGTRD